MGAIEKKIVKKTKKQRQAETREMDKCRCGNVLGLKRVALGKKSCRACDPDPKPGDDGYEVKYLQNLVDDLERRVARLESKITINDFPINRRV